jgi:hypothetical protein
VVKQLVEAYAGQPVVFLEENVDDYADVFHYGAWWAANESASGLMLPLILAGSGSQHSSGPVDFPNVYREMVDRELARAPGAELSGSWRRTGDGVQAAVSVVNRSGTALSDANAAQVGVIVYERGPVGMTGRLVRGYGSARFPSPLADGGSATLAVEIPALKAVADWNALQAVALVDYKPSGATRWDNLQAAALAPEPRP